MTIQTAIATVASAPSAGVAACALAAMSSASVFASSFDFGGATNGKCITKRGSATGRTNEEHRNTWSNDRDNQSSCGAVEVSKF